MDNNNKSLVIGVAVVAILAGAFFVYWWNKENAASPENLESALEEAQVGASVTPPSANPLESVAPAANPVEKTNPFKYENPFE